MNNINCKDCLYFQTKEKQYDTNLLPTLGYCNKAKQLWDCTEWHDDGSNEWDSCKRRLKEKYEHNKMFVKDGSDYHAVLIVTEDFGCKEFKSNRLTEEGE